MPKRFTETDKWTDPWFRKLPAKSKLLWLYLIDRCDNAGFWVVDFEFASYLVGETVSETDILPYAEGRIIPNGDKWEIIKFISFQYGKLSSDCKPHQNVIKLLEKQRVCKGYTKGMYTLEDKDKDKDKDKKEGSMRGDSDLPTLDMVKIYCSERNNDVDPDKWFNFYSSKDWMIGKNKMKDWKASVRTWEKKQEYDNRRYL